MTNLDLDAIEARAARVKQGPLTGPRCSDAMSLARTDVPALVAALRKARAEVARWEVDFPCDEGCRDYPEETCSRHGRRPADLWDRSDQAFRERDDLRRRYHDLRDAVLALCDAPDGAFMAAYVLVPRIREVAARVERGGAAKGIDIHRDFGVSES